MNKKEELEIARKEAYSFKDDDQEGNPTYIGEIEREGKVSEYYRLSNGEYRYKTKFLNFKGEKITEEEHLFGGKFNPNRNKKRATL